MQSLARAEAGTAYTIKWMFGAPQVLEFLDEFGIKEGSSIDVFQKGKAGMIIGRDEVRLAISGNVAQRIQV